MIKSVLVMGQDTHGVNKNKKFFLSNYSLTYQLFFINLLVSLIGFFALFIFNFYLIKNDKNIIIDYDNAYLKINKITSFLEKNSILRVPLFNENCESIKKNQECENIILSNPELEPTSTQQFVVQNFLNEEIKQKVLSHKPVLVSISCLFSMASEVAHDVAAFVKSADTNAKVLMGGGYPTNSTKEALQDHNLDLVIIGEGASGGALGIGVGDKVMMLENTWYSVISPESGSSILWRSWEYKEQAADALKLTAKDMKKQKLIDEIVKEPVGGAHSNREETFDTVKNAILEAYDEFKNLSPTDLVNKRMDKYLDMGVFKG